MINSLVLIEGTSVKEETLKFSLTNAKQVVIGYSPSFGVILHVGANTTADLANALLDFTKVSGVTAVLPLHIKTRQ
jgi:hypothetical protein